MSVYIYQPDALERMATVEGEQWLRQQSADAQSAYGFHAWLAAWRLKQEQGEEFRDEPVREFLAHPGDGTIYGDGGYARYAVRPDGELILLASSTRAERITLALAQGFRVL